MALGWHWAPPIHRTSGKFQSCRNRFREAPSGGSRQTKASMASQKTEKRWRNDGKTPQNHRNHRIYMGCEDDLGILNGILWWDWYGVFRHQHRWWYGDPLVNIRKAMETTIKVLGKSSINGPSKRWQCDKTWRLPPVRWRPSHWFFCVPTGANWPSLNPHVIFLGI